MKLQLLCPDFAGSAIAYLTRLVAAELAREHEVTLLTDMSPPGLGSGDCACELLDLAGTGVEVAPMGSYAGPSDALPVFVIAGHPAFDRTLGWALQTPGLVVLHDHYLWDPVERLVEPTRGYQILGRRRFTPGLAELREAWLHRRPTEFGDWYQDSALSLTLEDVVARRALHVFTHGSRHAAQLQPRCLGGASWHRLPPLIPREGPTIPESLEQQLPAAARVVVTFGVLTWNKCVDRLLQALNVGSATDGDVHLVAAGSIDDDYRSHLLACAEDLGLSSRFHLTGRVSPGQLRWLLARSDAVAQLRDPALNVGTASVVDALDAGKHVVVYDQGSFAEFPDDVVTRVPPTDDPVALWDAISKVLARDEAQIRRASQEYVNRHHCLSGYVAALTSAATSALETRSEFQALESQGRSG